MFLHTSCNIILAALLAVVSTHASPSYKAYKDCRLPDRENINVRSYMAGKWNRDIGGKGWHENVKGYFRVLYFAPMKCHKKKCDWTYKNRLFIEAWEFGPFLYDQVPNELQSVFVGCKEVLDAKIMSASYASEFVVEDDGSQLELHMTLFFRNNESMRYSVKFPDDFINHFY